MKPNRSIPQATVIPVLIYPDVRDAVAWLSDAFGFAERLQIGERHRSQMRVGDGGAVILGDVRDDRRPPRPGETTHSVLVRVADARHEPALLERVEQRHQPARVEHQRLGDRRLRRARALGEDGEDAVVVEFEARVLGGRDRPHLESDPQAREQEAGALCELARDRLHLAGAGDLGGGGSGNGHVVKKV